MATSFNRPLLNTTTSLEVSVNVPPTPSFSDIQFKFIGQTPDLLRRMSDINTDSHILEDSGSERTSLSPEPDLVNELLTSENSDNAPDLPKQPSLRERLKIVDSIETASTAANTSEIRPASIFNWKPEQTSTIALINSEPSTMALEASTILSLVHSPSVDDDPMASSSTSRQPLRISPTLGDNNVLEQTQTIPKDSGSVQSTGRKPEEVPHNPSHLTESSTSGTATTNSEPPIFAALKALQIRLAASLTDLIPIKTQDTVILARSAKAQCTEVSASANHAYSLAQKALTTAEESMSAAKECLAVAKTIQNRTDEVLVAVEQISNGGRVWNDTVQTLIAGLHELEEWSEQIKSQHRHEQEERERERQGQRLTAQRQDSSSNIKGTSCGISSIGNDPHIASLASANTSLPNPLRMSIEHEADANARAWNQLREQRRQAAEEELRKRREREELLEREQNEARSAYATARAERIAAEEKEKARQEKEDREAELQRQELERKLEEAHRARKASDDRALKVTQEKERAEREETLYRIQEEEQRRKEITEREIHERRLATEKAQALEKQALEAKRQQQLHEHEVKRQEVASRKQQAASEAAQRIQSDRARSKQIQAQVENNITTFIQNTSLPITSSPDQQINFRPQHAESGLGHADDSSTENPDHPWKAEEDMASRGTDGDSVLRRIAASTISSNRLVTLTPRFPESDRPSLALPLTSTASSAPMVDDINSLPRAISMGSEPSTHSQPKNVSVNVGRNGNAAGIIQRTHKDIQSLPSLTILSPTLSGASGTRPVGLQNKSVHSNGQDHGNVGSIPKSQPSPIAQRAELHPSVTKTDVIAKSPEVKVEFTDDSPLLRLERVSTAPVSSESLMSSQYNNWGRFSQSEREAESSTAIPLLSLPLPPARTTPFKDKETTSSVETVKASEAEMPRPKPEHSTEYVSKAAHPTQTVTTQQYNTIANPQAPPWSNPLLVATLPPKPPGLPMRGASKSIGQYNDRDAGSRMRPDTVMADIQIQPSTSRENNQDLSLNQRQDYARPSTWPISHDDRHYSPPPGTVNKRTQQRTRPRRGDRSALHRGLSPLPAYNGYVSPVRSRSRGSSGNNSRAATPEIPYQNQPLLHQGVPLKRKRVHPNDQVSGPPQRRPRYEDQPTYEAGPHNHTGAQYASMSMRNDSQADWSNIANYSRSPSPEPHRAPPLRLRMNESDNSYRPPSPESLRPRPLRLRLGEGDRHYRPDQRLNDQHVDPPLYNRQAAIQGSNYHNEPSKYHMPRLNAGQPTSDSRPPLLDRFTDATPYSIPSNHHAQHPAPSRGSRPRGRGGIHQSSAPRTTTKGHLIDRLGDP